MVKQCPEFDLVRIRFNHLGTCVPGTKHGEELHNEAFRNVNRRIANNVGLRIPIARYFKLKLTLLHMFENIYFRPGWENQFSLPRFLAENRVPVGTRSVAKNRGE